MKSLWKPTTNFFEAAGHIISDISAPPVLKIMYEKHLKRFNALQEFKTSRTKENSVCEKVVNW